MINVAPAKEPQHFDKSVRKKGIEFLHKNSIAANIPLSAGVRLEPFWRNCLDDLHMSYAGVCSYLCIHLEPGVGGVTTDHFIPKSIRPGLAYEWSNFRLACSRVNSKKGSRQNILDPFLISDGWFQLEFLTGTVFSDPLLNNAMISKITRTIEILGLNLPYAMKRRSKDFSMLIENQFSEDFFSFLKNRSPFVYKEAVRQNLLSVR